MFTAVPTYYQNRSKMSLEWMNAMHYSLFTHKSLDQLCARHGLEPVAHTYRGSTKFIDEVWHVARFTGRPTAPEAHYEDAHQVARYVAVRLGVSDVEHLGGLHVQALEREAKRCRIRLRCARFGGRHDGVEAAGEPGGIEPFFERDVPVGDAGEGQHGQVRHGQVPPRACQGQLYRPSAWRQASTAGRCWRRQTTSQSSRPW